ncbi:hypothetical protein B0H15DRAFT_402094 [Mycena belliarum]|uniref:Uncharacterized protein n=1 Tax=Mycena belliarum TaxID=1033014 RepID=A0AAD6U2X8_9AGAR|nr:hypothetical protein B0H15DRAFT_402094 [Mycena belliae]
MMEVRVGDRSVTQHVWPSWSLVCFKLPPSRLVWEAHLYTFARPRPELLRPAPPVLKARDPPTSGLASLPSDVLHIIVLILQRKPTTDEYRPDQTWDEEFCSGAPLIPLSETCRYLRAQTKPQIFRHVYNWSRADGAVWPDTLWPFITEARLRHHSIRHPKPISVSTELFQALPLMPSLTKVVLSLEWVPAELLVALSLVPQLNNLEIEQARLDGPSLHLTRSSFASLESLRICIWRYTANIATRVVDSRSENDNLAELLRAVHGRLTILSISGDLLSPHFLSLQWPLLRKFVVTEHTPTPYLSVPELTTRMPALRELSVLFSADLVRTGSELRPPFTLGNLDGPLLSDSSPHLHTVTLSNLQPDDPIFSQLPRDLDALHIRAACDLYISARSARRSLQEAALTSSTVFNVVRHIARLTNLTELTLTLDYFPTPALIDIVASACPGLRVLELGYLRYGRGDVYVEDVRDDALLQPLARLTRLAHLRISLDFYARDPPLRQQYPQGMAASWLFENIATLQSVAFTWQNWTRWAKFRPLEQTRWETYDRRVIKAVARTAAALASMPISVLPEAIVPVGIPM